MKCFLILATIVLGLAGCVLFAQTGDGLQTFYVTDIHDGWNVIKVRAKDRVWAEIAALRTTVWTEKEWQDAMRMSTDLDKTPWGNPQTLTEIGVRNHYLRTDQPVLDAEGSCWRLTKNVLHRIECPQ